MPFKHAVPDGQSALVVQPLVGVVQVPLVGSHFWPAGQSAFVVQGDDRKAVRPQPAAARASTRDASRTVLRMMLPCFYSFTAS